MSAAPQRMAAAMTHPGNRILLIGSIGVKQNEPP